MIKTYAVTYPTYSWKFWQSYIVQMRPYLLFVSGIAGIAGLAISSHAETPSWKIITAFLPFFLGYGFGQALTDCFQTDTDKLSAPYRPLSKGILSIRSVLIVSITGLSICGILLYLLHPLNSWFCALSVFGLATYSFIKKKYWYAGPFYNAWIVTLLPVMGYFIALDGSAGNLSPVFLSTILITFFSYASFVLIGYLKDIEADQATGYKTFPVIFGWIKTILLGDIFAIITIILFWSQGNKNIYEILFGFAATAILITGQAVGHLSRNKNEKGALIPILSTVRSFILFHIAIVLHYQPHWLIPISLFYILFELTLYFRPSRYQV